MIEQARLLAEFENIVSFDSETFHEAALKDYLKSKLRDLGLEVWEDGAAELLGAYGATAGNLYAGLPGNAPGEPLLFSAHMDTVSPGRGKRAVRHPDGRITSDGNTVLGADDGAGLAAILEALTVIRDRRLPHPEIELLLPVAEELYGRGSALIDYSRIRAKSAYVLDLTGPIGRAAICAPSILSLEITVRGRAAHAGFAPETGINALSIAAQTLAKLDTGHVNGDTTVNFGSITGGTGKNIVPAEVRILGEVRSLRHEEALARGEQIREAFRREAEALGGSAEVQIIEEVHAYRTEEDAPVVQRFRRALAALDLGQPELVTTFGGSDHNNFALHGIQGLVLACGMEQVHSVQEYTECSALCQSAKLTLQLMTLEEA